MGSILHTIIYFLIALSILIAFHEYGHFWVARKVGVKVLRFSIGLGRPIWSYQKDPDSTEFSVAALPLGGYVRMVDEREGEVKPEDLPYAFNRQSIAARSAIVLAGPVFNLMLAILIYWVISVVGETGMRPVLGPVNNDTYAAQAGFKGGDEIIAVAEQETPTWSLAMGAIFSRVMDDQQAGVDIRSEDGTRRQLKLVVPEEAANDPNLLRDRLGFNPWQPDLPPMLDNIEAGSPADRAGMEKGDVILTTNGSSIRNWTDWVEYIRARPGKELNVEVKRNEEVLAVKLKPDSVETADGPIGRIGASVKVPQGIVDSMQVEYRLGIVDGFGASLQRTYDFSLLTLKMIGRMIIGKAAIENLSGPISIAQYAGQSASLGIIQFLKFLAIVSISLGVLNLLPVPVLDGGHLLYFCVEAIKGSPVSESAQLIGQQVGIAILVSLMGLAFFLDIERLLA